MLSVATKGEEHPSSRGSKGFCMPRRNCNCLAWESDPKAGQTSAVVVRAVAQSVCGTDAHKECLFCPWTDCADPHFAYNYSLGVSATL